MLFLCIWKILSSSLFHFQNTSIRKTEYYLLLLLFSIDFNCISNVTKGVFYIIHQSNEDYKLNASFSFIIPNPLFVSWISSFLNFAEIINACLGSLLKKALGVNRLTVSRGIQEDKEREKLCFLTKEKRPTYMRLYYI